MKRSTLAYWILTGVFCLAFSVGGLGHLFRTEAMREGLTHLGYPVYLTTILGVAKLLGVAALLVPGRPLLKEWAYAGFTFDLLGAAASHAFVGDPFSETVKPLALLVVGVGSYLLRPGSRRLGADFPAAESTAAGAAAPALSKG